MKKLLLLLVTFLFFIEHAFTFPYNVYDVQENVWGTIDNIDFITPLNKHRFHYEEAASPEEAQKFLSDENKGTRFNLETSAEKIFRDAGGKFSPERSKGTLYSKVVNNINDFVSKPTLMGKIVPKTGASQAGGLVVEVNAPKPLTETPLVEIPVTRPSCGTIVCRFVIGAVAGILMVGGLLTIIDVIRHAIAPASNYFTPWLSDSKEVAPVHQYNQSNPAQQRLQTIENRYKLTHPDYKTKNHIVGITTPLGIPQMHINSIY